MHGEVAVEKADFQIYSVGVGDGVGEVECEAKGTKMRENERKWLSYYDLFEKELISMSLTNRFNSIMIV